MSEIVKAIRQVVKSMIKPDLLIGTVKSFESVNWTISVELNQGGTVEDVTIRSVLNDDETGVFIEPEVGSIVLCAMADGKLENLKVVLFSEIVNMELMPKEQLKLRGDDFGGLVKLKDLENNLDALKQYCEAMKNAVMTGLNAVGASTAASGPNGATAFNGAMSSQAITFKDMENKNVTHG
ncbi:MAG: hypothetical protein J0G96_07140 [Flavobacteriia bacterium]|nr:hypothetical protein [Flavobacteriia bacterium]